MEFNAARGIPEDALSCHTALVEGYAIVGHVPVGAIAHLVETQPMAIGLALPGMPADSAGMGGTPVTWESQPVLLITGDGESELFDY